MPQFDKFTFFNQIFWLVWSYFESDHHFSIQKSCDADGINKK